MAKTSDVCYVYCHYNRINGKSYVGISTNPIRRWGSNGCGYTKGHPCFARAIKKYGWNNFDHYILEECSFEQAKELEKYYIEVFNSKSPNGYNLTDGGEGVLGYVFDEDTRKRMSKSMKGRKSNRKGCCLSEITKQKISKANSNRFVSDETRKKISIASLGRKHTEESKRKMSERKLGVKFSDEHKKHLSQSHLGKTPSENAMKKIRKPICMYSKNGRLLKTFKSLSDASKYVVGVLGACSNISRVCNGERKSSYGYIWRWKCG